MEQNIEKKLSAKRRELGIPATVVARKLHINRQTLSNKELGKSVLTVSEFVDYCRALGLKENEVINLLFF